jgi:hypothetical protein
VKVAAASNGPNGPSRDYFAMLAEWERDTLPEFPADECASELRNTIVSIALVPSTYADFARAKRISEAAGFGGSFSPPAGSLDP